MVGQLKFGAGRSVLVEWGRLYGLPVMRAEINPSGWMGRQRLRQAGRRFYRGGVIQTLVPNGFDQWQLMGNFGLCPVDPEPLVRTQGDRLALETLHRSGVSPQRATVALRGSRADADMARAAALLCPRVQHLVITAPRGGYDLALRLRREFGLPVLPADEGAHVGLYFGPESVGEEDVRLELYGSKPNLAGLVLSVPDLEEGDRYDLSLLTALWQGGRLGKGDLKIT